MAAGQQLLSYRQLSFHPILPIEIWWDFIFPKYVYDTYLSNSVTCLCPGSEATKAKPPEQRASAKSYFYRMRYTPETGRFEWTKNPKELMESEEKDPLHCSLCAYNKEFNTGGKVETFLRVKSV